MKSTLPLIFLFLSFSTKAQNIIQERFVNAIDSFNYLAPRESAYLLTDRQLYKTGEVVLFKGHITLNGVPTQLSKVGYVTVTDGTGKVVEKQMVKLEGGSTHGQISVSTKWPTGSYTIEFFSLWMKNFPESVYKSKIIFINPTLPTEQEQSKAKSTATISFFPEGGSLISGIENRIAFKAERNLQPQHITGSVTDSKGAVVAKFSSTHDGMGFFLMTPKAGEPYTANVNFLNGQILSYTLPIALPEGVCLKVDNASKIYLNVSRSGQNPLFNETFIVGRQEEQVVYFNKFNFDEGLNAAAISKKNLKPGVLQLTLFTKDAVPIAERMVFIENYDLQEIATTSVNKSIRTKNSIEIADEGFTNLDAAVVVANSSISSGENILSRLLLCDKVNGLVYSPTQYFRDKTTETLGKIDLVMLTNGWRGYKWADILLSNYPPLYYPFERSLSIGGNVYGPGEKIPLTSGKVNFIIRGEDSTSAISEVALNEKGQFVLDNLSFEKKATIGYQATAKSNANMYTSVKISPSFIDTLQRTIPTPDLLYEEEATTKSVSDINNEKLRAKILENVIIKARKRSMLDSLRASYVSEAFQMSDQTLVMDNLNYFDMWQYLSRYVPGLKLVKTDTGTVVSFSRYEGSNFFASEESTAPTGVQFFLNEVAVTTEVIETLNPADVSIVMVYKGLAAIPLGAFQGAISIYTVKGKSGRDFRDKGFDTVDKQGYNVPFETYNIDYSQINIDSIPPGTDLRNTLYWSPKVNFKNGKATINFYISDVIGDIFIRVEGIDEKGKLYFSEMKY